MITIDCPICEGEATTDESLVVVACETCGTSVDVAPDAPTLLDAAA